MTTYVLAGGCFWCLDAVYRRLKGVGTQYRSAMYYSDDAQKKAFEAAAERATSHWDKPLVTEIKQLDKFYPAEDYHQDYFNKNPGNGYCSIVIEPKIVKARAAYTKWFKEN
jgi:peptide-methionine (S)-S-oxide reductase